MAARWQRLALAPPGVALAARGGAIVMALLTAAALLALYGAHPLALGAQVIKSTFGSRFGLEDVGLLVTPLIFTGLSVAIALSIGAWNIGAEGQFYAGAFASTGVGLYVQAPAPLMLPLMFAAGALGGAAWILVPTLARAYAEVSELITTLLLNFVAVLLVYWVATGPWLDPSGHALGATARIAYEVPGFWGDVHWGLPIAIALAALASLALRYTVWGYEVRIAGANPGAADFAGMPTRARLIVVMLLSGAVAGTAHHLQGGISNNFGYLGIMVAVLARGSPLGVIPGALFMGVILDGGIVLQTKGLTVSTVLAITGLILFYTAIGDELAHYRWIRPKRGEA